MVAKEKILSLLWIKSWSSST